MRTWATLLVTLLLVVGLAGTADAKGKKKNKGVPPDPGISGAVVKVDDKDLVIKMDTGEEKTLKTDTATVVIINGTTSTLADLKADQRVKVTPTFGTPLRVEVGAIDPPPTPAKKGKKNKNK